MSWNSSWLGKWIGKWFGNVTPSPSTGEITTRGRTSTSGSAQLKVFVKLVVDGTTISSSTCILKNKGRLSSQGNTLTTGAADLLINSLGKLSSDGLTSTNGIATLSVIITTPVKIDEDTSTEEYLSRYTNEPLDKYNAIISNNDDDDEEVIMLVIANFIYLQSTNINLSKNNLKKK